MTRRPVVAAAFAAVADSQGSGDSGGQVAVTDDLVIGERLPRMPFDVFVVTYGDRLLRTAFLLTRDHTLAEDLLQTSLTRAWSSWRRIEADPQSYVRKIMVNTYATWGRRKCTGEHPTDVLPETGPPGEIDAHADRHDLWTALGRLPRRQQ